MRPDDRDLAYLWDMREAAREVVEFMQGVTYERFAVDKVLRRPKQMTECHARQHAKESPDS